MLSKNQSLTVPEGKCILTLKMVPAEGDKKRLLARGEKEEVSKKGAEAPIQRAGRLTVLALVATEVGLA